MHIFHNGRLVTELAISNGRSDADSRGTLASVGTSEDVLKLGGQGSERIDWCRAQGPLEKIQAAIRDAASSHQHNNML